MGATIIRSQSVGTITDDDTTKFYVVDDASTDRTYRYGLPGTTLGNSILGNGNTAPRDAASNAAGNTVWVVDANKKVYVYNTGGALLGSWTAGGLPSNAQVEGIATNNMDVWLVANSTSKDNVFKYTGAASRLSGTQNAASSFSLNKFDTNSKGLVTDGAALWIVDDGATDKVFKYTLTGTLLGSWTIDPANSHPTGLTITPASPSDIWYCGQRHGQGLPGTRPRPAEPRAARVPPRPSPWRPATPTPRTSPTRRPQRCSSRRPPLPWPRASGPARFPPLRFPAECWPLLRFRPSPVRMPSGPY